VLLIFEIVAGPVVATAFGVLAALLFGLLWFLLPLRSRRARQQG
jgi:membrane protein implicated in regulation of membrane protease activity